MKRKSFFSRMNAEWAEGKFTAHHVFERPTDEQRRLKGRERSSAQGSCSRFMVAIVDENEAVRGIMVCWMTSRLIRCAFLI